MLNIHGSHGNWLVLWILMFLRPVIVDPVPDDFNLDSLLTQTLQRKGCILHNMRLSPP